MNVYILQYDVEGESTIQYSSALPSSKKNQRISRANTLEGSHLYVVSGGTLNWESLVPLVAHNLKVLPWDLQVLKNFFS